MAEELPKQELLIKLLKMTSSSNDGEAIVALRKANQLLVSAGWDWERLIHGKIKVVEDPFKNIQEPDRGAVFARPRAPAPPPPPQPKPTPRPFTPSPPPFATNPPPRPKPAQPQPLGNRSNMYAGWCYCCGDAVDNKDGFLFDPSTKNSRAKSKQQVVCKKCNTANVFVGTTAAPRVRPLGNLRAPSLNDI